MAQESATSIYSMIELGIVLLKTNPLQGVRQVIDISSDGRNNTGHDIAAAQALALNQGVTVNGLVILNEDSTLNYYFDRHVIAGPDAFIVLAADYDDYAVAILRKLIREIGKPAMS